MKELTPISTMTGGALFLAFRLSQTGITYGHEAFAAEIERRLALVDAECEECHGTELSPSGDEPWPECSNPRTP